MKISDFKCNLCGEGIAHVDELIGVKLDSNAEFCPTNVENTDTHLCDCCLIAIEDFCKKWKKREEMSPAEKYAWGLCW
jgi:hypothetical protein